MTHIHDLEKMGMYHNNLIYDDDTAEINAEESVKKLFERVFQEEQSLEEDNDNAYEVEDLFIIQLEEGTVLEYDNGDFIIKGPFTVRLQDGHIMRVQKKITEKVI